MAKTSGYTGAIVVAALLVTPALAQTPVPDHRPRLTLSLQIVVNDQRGTGIEGVGVGVSGSDPRGLPHATERRGRNPLIVLSTLAGAACPAAPGAQSSGSRR